MFRVPQYLHLILTVSLRTSVWIEVRSRFFSNPPIAPMITSMIPISMMKKEIPIAKKFAASSATTKIEKTAGKHQ